MKINLETIKSLKGNLFIQSDIDIVGIRGCSASVYGEWLEEIDIEPIEIDYESMNCIFIVFKMNQMMVLRGSTVPHSKYIKKAFEVDGNGSNRLEIGFYKSYSKGTHYPSEQTAHKALKQTRAQPVRRTSDNLTFDNADRIEIANVSDNIHAAWTGLNGKTHASAGCQVIAGYPDCKKRSGNTLHWKIFYDHIYSLEQLEFNYLLIDYKYVHRTVYNTMKPMFIYGSESDLINAIQRVLKVNQTGSYLKETYQAVLNFQKEHELVIDGLIGAETLKQLGNLK